MVYSSGKIIESPRDRSARMSANDLKSRLKKSHPLFLSYIYLYREIKRFFSSFKSDEVIVDFGCGQKPYKAFINSEIKYIGIDIDKSNDKADIISSVYSVNLNDNSADYSVSFQVIEHLEKPQEMLSEMYRITKPGGKIMLTFPLSWELHEEPNDFFRYTHYGMFYLLNSVGFQNLKVVRLGCGITNFVLKLNKIINKPVLKLIIPILNTLAYRLEKNNDNDVVNYAVYAIKK